ncbi:hypothetical protein F4778DRAFT_253798 [Xylariomycetidae sp. FL2044]|nr:hypothetical protein F4778DRAFT_253798 [Xylariomycetidae sp. FL2044]
MSQTGSIIASKAAKLAGPVHRPSDDASTSTLTCGAVAELEATPGTSGPVELPAGEVSSDNLAANQLPPYSSPVNFTEGAGARPPVPKGPLRFPGLPVLDYRLYSPPLFDLSDDSKTITSRSAHLSENSRSLGTLLQSLAAVPPKPQIVIQGNRGRKVDFSVKLNLMSLLVPEDPRERVDYLRCVGKGEMALRGGTNPDYGDEDSSLEQWCERYVGDQAPVKSFALERVVANLDTPWLEGQIRSLVATTTYKGVVKVEFPVTHTKVVVKSPNKANKLVSSITNLWSSKSKYEVAKAVWPFANARPGEPGRKCMVQSEQTFWEEWRDPIKYAIVTKRQGWVTNEDKLECVMENVGNGVSLVDWGPEYEY